MTVLRVTSVLLAALLLAGCANGGTSLPSFGCTVFKPITYSRKHDTRETVRQIVAHNAVGVESCGWKR